MPWLCCGANLSDDESACPACGGSKKSWTLRFDKTRVFSFKGKEWELEDLDSASGSRDEEAPEQEDEDWDLEALDALPADEDGAVAGGQVELEKLAKEAEPEPPPEDDDWDLDALDARPADADGVVASGGAGTLERSSRETDAPADAPAEEEEDWELEALEHAAD